MSHQLLSPCFGASPLTRTSLVSCRIAYWVCCEAKGIRDDVIVSQILGEVKALFRTRITQDLILPIAVKALAPSRVFVVEFETVAREDADEKNSLEVASAALYDFVPPIPGIGQ